VERGKTLAGRFRAVGALVVLVNVAPAMEEPPRRVDEPSTLAKILPEGFIDLAPGLAEPSDLKITKKSWGAFSVPELDLKLRERGVRTIALGGVATQFGIVKDATSSTAPEAHDNSMRRIFPRIARIAESNALTFSPA
jgi:nicotinamidase-related amidase